MIIFILTKEGFTDLGAFAEESKCPIWVNQGVLSQTEIASLRARGGDLTGFGYEIRIESQEAINEALYAISEHHPGERIWVEFQSKT